jgi:GrpB-like predicted nucleotidyltransferase (UPF0157 family)
MNVVVVDHRPEWAEHFRLEQERLSTVFTEVDARIEHIGSTSVPGLPAKPIIDICVGLTDLRHAEDRIGALESLGYEYVPEYEALLPDRRYFRRPGRRPRTHHVHCCVWGGPIWTRHLLFRDYLRSEPRVAGEYGALKRLLVGRHSDDRTAYTEAKDPFITRVLERASR